MINLPVVQTAVKDGIDQAAMVMSGRTDGIANPIQFHNAVAFFEFNFIAPQGINVSSVKIETTDLSQGALYILLEQSVLQMLLFGQNRFIDSGVIKY